ncbi:ribosomal protein S2 [Sistotremastrum niveocremeum HHB9708]|uniref:Ribosomal protein S2 n=1 Tax=Sistotremastrum niveocremeum HHB9708 TaxID=1314777 RepID=A0A165AH06_9AGAM|nr:ribosomal protein S2 [Sistotremastrum niveocremeum HHB9708]
MSCAANFRKQISKGLTCSPRHGLLAKRCYSTPQDSQEKVLQNEDDWHTLQETRARQKHIMDRFSRLGSTQSRDNTWQPHHGLHKPPPPKDLTLSSLVAAGAHFGHSSSLMNPNFLPYSYGTRAGITIIDLDSTLPLLRRAVDVTRAIAARDGTIVFVGTRPDLRRVVNKAAERMGSNAYSVGERWLPGTLTNKVQLFGPEVAQTQRVVPDLVILLNPLANMHVIRECAISHVPTIGIIDSNVDPRIVLYPIPANDESTRTAELVAGVLSIAGKEGLERFREQQAAAQAASQRSQRRRS